MHRGICITAIALLSIAGVVFQVQQDETRDRLIACYAEIPGVESDTIEKLMMLAFGSKHTELAELENKLISDAGNSERLTVAETLSFLLIQEYEGSPWKYYPWAHPDAKQVLYHVLQDDQFLRLHPPVWYVLGYIGDESDVQRIEQAIAAFRSTPGKLTGSEKDILMATFISLGILCGREVEGADELARKLQKPSYWRDAEFRWEDSSQIGVEYETLVPVMLGYAFSFDPHLAERTQAILETIDDPKTAEIMEKALGTKLLQDHARNTTAEAGSPISVQDRRSLLTNFNKALIAPGPPEPLGRFEEISRMLVPISGRVISNSDVVKIKKITRDFSYKADGDGDSRIEERTGIGEIPMR